MASVANQGTMKSRRQQKKRKTSSNLIDTDQHQHYSSLPLPMDLMIDIFSRLSLKSIATCRCVSKPWASVLGHSYFRDLRLTMSQARPRLLFAIKEDYNKVSFLSSPQPQSPDEMSSPVAVDRHMSFTFNHPVKNISASVNGLVCVRISGHRVVNGRRFKVEESALCNPSTGQAFVIPRMKTRKRVRIVRFLGYDPVEKLHKVLGMIRTKYVVESDVEHQVLTLGGGGGTWRMTKCGIPCASSGRRKSICINGVFYWFGTFTYGSGDDKIICFDVRSEKYSYVKSPEGKLYHNPVDCNGKLGLVPKGKSCNFKTETVEVWVLQDPETHEWSKRVYMLPPMWKDVVGPKEWLEVVRVTGPNELVMSPKYSADPFHVYYCDFGKGTVTRLVIQGMGAFGSGRRSYTYLNHVEDVKLMEL